MKIRKQFIYTTFIVVLLSTEFYHINFLSGALRPYHFLTPLVILFLFSYIKQVVRTGIFLALAAFFSWNILAAALADSPLEAFKSFGLLAANMSITIAVAVVLVSGNLDLNRLIKIALAVTIFGVIVGVSQLILYYAAGVDLSFSSSHERQIAMGFSSGLRTEANTFAKNLNTVFLLILPHLLSEKNWRRSLLIFAIIVLGMLTSLTRSALYGLAVTLVITYLWYLSRSRGLLIKKRPLIAAVLLTLALSIFASVVIYFNPYAAYKLAVFFDSKEIVEGTGSAGLRLMSQGVLWDAFLATDKTFFFGNGWGQVSFTYGDWEMQAGGAELVTALGYGGIFGGLLYLLYQLTAINSVRRCIMANPNSAFLWSSQGVMLALIGLLVTGQINGALIAPEYWMVFGMAIAVVIKARAERRKMTRRTVDRLLD